MKSNASALKSSAEDLVDELKELLDDNDRWLGGENGLLFRDARALEQIAEDLDDSVKDNASRETVNGLIRAAREKIRVIRTLIVNSSATSKAQEELWRCEGFLLAMQAGDIVPDDDHRHVMKEMRDEWNDAWGRQNYRESEGKKAKDSNGTSAGFMSTHAIGYGDRNVTMANSTARRYVNRTYGVPHERMETTKILPSGDKVSVTIESAGTRYLVEVNSATNSVAKASVKR